MGTTVRVRYRKGDLVQILELKGDPFDVCNAVSERIYGRPVATHDPKHDALMREINRRSTERSKP